MKRPDDKKLLILPIGIAIFVFCSMPLSAKPADVTSSQDERAVNNDIHYKLYLAKSYKDQSYVSPGEPLYFTRAIKLYEEILAADPGNKEALAEMAEMYTQKGDAGKADDLYRKLGKIDPAYAASRKNDAAKEAENRRRREREFDQLDRAAQPDTSNAEYKLGMAKSYKIQSYTDPADRFYFDKAITAYKEVLAADPENKEALADMAELYIQEGDTAKSDELYKKLEKIDPAYAASRKGGIEKDAAKQVQFKLELARSYIEQVRNEPKNAAALDHAIEQYAAVLKSSPDQAEAIKGLAAAYAHKGNFEESEKMFKKAIAADPKNMFLRLNLGSLYYSKGMKEKAQGQVDLMLERDPGNGRARLLQAIIFEGEKDFAPAITEYKAALHRAEKTRDMDLALRSLLGLGRTYEKADLYFDAVSQFEKIIRLRPNLAEGYLELVRVTSRVGLIDKTIATLNALIAVKPDMPEVHALLGQEYFRKGDYEKSLEQLNKAIGLGLAINKDLIAKVQQKVEESKKKGGQGEKGN